MDPWGTPHIRFPTKRNFGFCKQQINKPKEVLHWALDRATLSLKVGYRTAALSWQHCCDVFTWWTFSLLVQISEVIGFQDLTCQVCLLKGITRCIVWLLKILCYYKVPFILGLEKEHKTEFIGRIPSRCFSNVTPKIEMLTYTWSSNKSYVICF